MSSFDVQCSTFFKIRIQGFEGSSGTQPNKINQLNKLIRRSLIAYSPKPIAYSLFLILPASFPIVLVCVSLCETVANYSLAQPVPTHGASLERTEPQIYGPNEIRRASIQSF